MTWNRDRKRSFAGHVSIFFLTNRFSLPQRSFHHSRGTGERLDHVRIEICVLEPASKKSTENILSEPVRCEQFIHHSGVMDSAEEASVESAINEIRLIQRVLNSVNGFTAVNQQLPTAQSAMTLVDATTLMDQPDRITDQTLIISELQRLAYQDQDAGGVQDVAEWCVAQWLHILQHSPDCLEALQGLGQAWLARAQACLARIHHEEGSPSSGSGSGGRPGTSGSQSYTTSDDARDFARAAADADARLHTADYVEARGILLPATEYFRKAVDAADNQSRLTGELLSFAAEAHMSLGNVSYSTANEQYFRQALLYLRRASRLEGFTLSTYLEGYLDDYGRLID